MNQQQSARFTSFIVFSILLIIVMIVVILIQLAIITSYFMTRNRGRCVYKDENGSCACKFTNKKACDSLHGLYNSNLTCADGFEAQCSNLPPAPPIPTAPTHQ